MAVAAAEAEAVMAALVTAAAVAGAAAASVTLGVMKSSNDAGTWAGRVQAWENNRLLLDRKLCAKLWLPPLLASCSA